jgi:hypothetical protein
LPHLDRESEKPLVLLTLEFLFTQFLRVLLVCVDTRMDAVHDVLQFQLWQRAAAVVVVVEPHGVNGAKKQ